MPHDQTNICNGNEHPDEAGSVLEVVDVKTGGTQYAVVPCLLQFQG